MKLISVLASILLLSCSNTAHNESAVPKKNIRDTSLVVSSNKLNLKTDTLMEAVWFDSHLHYYLPSTAEKKDTVLVLFIFDPAAKGSQQIRAWKSIANERSMMLLSVDDSRNGMKPSDVASKIKPIESMLTSILKKPFILYATGLSGGSRIAAALQGSNQFFKGLILCCAAPKLPELGCNTVLYSATEDMNFLECYEYFQAHPSKQLQMRIESGSHTWPNNSALDAMLKDVLAMPFRAGLVNVAKTSLLASTLNYEANQQILVNEDYFKKTKEYWQSLLKKRRASNETVEKRLLNYTSLYTYSVVNSPEVVNDLNAYDYTLSIYEWSDPNNNEWMYLRSIYYLQQKDEVNAFKYLEKAIKNDFSNTERLFQNMYWKNYTNDVRLTKLIAEMPN
jgi:hypothetical protein